MRFISNPEKRIIGSVIEDIVGSLIEKTIEPLMATNNQNDVFDKETVRYLIQIKGCRMFNRSRTTKGTKKYDYLKQGKFVIPKATHIALRKEAEKRNKIGIYWFALYLHEPVGYSMIHSFLTAEEVDKFTRGRNGNISIYWWRLLRQTKPITQL